MKRFLSLICLALCASSALAQVPTTGAGKGSPAGGGGGGYTGPGDVTGWTTGVVAFWGLRGFNAAFSGKVANICDNSSGTHCADATWSSAGGGTLTLPSVGGAGGTNPCDNSTNKCEIATLYEQSGGATCNALACDLTGTHGTNRPLLLVNCAGTKPCIQPTAGNMIPANGIDSTVNEPYTQSAVACRTSGVGQAAIASAKGGSVESLFASTANSIAMFNGSSVPTLGSVTDGTTHTLNFLFLAGTSNAKLQADAGAASAVTVNASAVAITALTLFHFPAVDNGALTGLLFEVGWWSGDKSANFSNMHTNQVGYWGTPGC